MTGTVKIHGKDYKTVALRVSEFREASPDWSIETEIIQNESGVVVMKAIISNTEGRVIGTGFAQEHENSSHINKTSALENCETSAIGRALSACGYGGENYASANEVSEAIIKQKQGEVVEYYKKMGEAIRESLLSILTIKEGIGTGELSGAAEAWYELSEDIQRALWVAPTKGGVFTTKEREIMQSGEFKV